MDLLFGSDMPPPLRFVLAFVIVLVLIGVVAWLVRRFASDRFGATQGRGRQPRLAVIDAATVDSRRRLVLIRRDNVEHLLLIGGPSDVVVEPNIVRAQGTPLLREPGGARPSLVSDPLPRPLPLGETGNWPLQPQTEPAARGASEPAPLDDFKRWQPPAEARSAPAIPDSVSVRPAARQEPALGETPRSVTRAPSAPLRPASERPTTGGRAVPEPAAVPAAPAVSVGDHAAPSPVPAGAEIKSRDVPRDAHRLDTSFRRTTADIRGNEPRVAPAPLRSGPAAPPPPAPPAATPTVPPPVVSSSPGAAAARSASEVKPVQPAERPAAGKSLYEDLEQEMANLLGRSSGKS